MARLTAEGVVTQAAIAQAAGWTGAYLSQFVRKAEGESGERKPKADKMRALIRALSLLAGQQPAKVAAQLRDQITPLAELYELELVPLGDPTLPIREKAPNFVDRAGIARFIEHNVPYAQVNAFDGGPRSGITTALRQAASRLRDFGYDVTEVSMQELVDTGQLGRSASGVVGSIVSHIDGIDVDAVLSATVWEVATLLRNELTRRPDGMAFVLDDLDALSPQAAEELNDWMRDMKAQRAQGEEGFARTTIWTGFTASSKGAARDHSWLHYDEIKVVPWFEPDDVEALATRLVPRAMSAGATGDWTRDATKAALRHFAGQPQLTHQFLWDRSLDGDANRVPPWSGAYKRHMDALSRAALDLLTEEGAREVVDCMQEGRPLPAYAVHTATVRLRICKGEDGQPANAFYAANLARALEHRISERQRTAKVSGA